MTPDARDTIVALATPRAPGARGVVRLAGDTALTIAERMTGETVAVEAPTRLPERILRVEVAGAARELACDLFVWPDRRSYTRQPAVELHSVGSPPLLDAIVRACLAAGARLAEPGEFTLRAFLAGRIDLTQAEAVLAVIDAKQASLLEPALAQLAGGLSRPLHRLREELLDLLADLEAGLDFVDEEDVRFVERDELAARVRSASQIVAEAQQQTSARSTAAIRPRVAITGPPNIGKSSLFNALVRRYGASAPREALVADQPGVTRDELRAEVEFDGVPCELIDTAGVSPAAPVDSIDRLARERVDASRRDADLLLLCERSGEASEATDQRDLLRVGTMSDLSEQDSPAGAILATSSVTGQGIETLALRIADRLTRDSAGGAAGAVADTAARCQASLEFARESLERAALLAAEGSGEELVSFELREALDALGRVVGAVVTDDILDLVFGKFCIGK